MSGSRVYEFHQKEVDHLKTAAVYALAVCTNPTYIYFARVRPEASRLAWLRLQSAKGLLEYKWHRGITPSSG